VVVGLISGNDEKAYLEKVANLSLWWCQDNSLMLNVSKTKELIVDCRRTQQHQSTYTPLGINGTAVERVSSFRYLGVHPDRKHHCLVQQQLLSGQEGSSEGGAVGCLNRETKMEFLSAGHQDCEL